MSESGLKLTGFDDLQKRLQELNAEFQQRAARAAVSAGARVLVVEAKKLAKQQGLELTGDLIENIAFKRERKAPPGRYQYNVGVRHGKDAKRAEKVVFYKGTRKYVVYRNDPFYWWFHEFGTSKHRARPFIRPAFEANQQRIVEVMGNRLRRSIEAFKRKYGSAATR